MRSPVLYFVDVLCPLSFSSNIPFLLSPKSKHKLKCVYYCNYDINIKIIILIGQTYLTVCTNVIDHNK
jgi:hypothetical protein